jgi:hypothetical protein
MLFVPDLACGIGNAAADIIEQTQQADSVSFPDFRRAPQRLDQIKGQKAVTEPGALPRWLCRS